MLKLRTRIVIIIKITGKRIKKKNNKPKEKREKIEESNKMKVSNSIKTENIL